jgi:hypothetical protein
MKNEIILRTESNPKHLKAKKMHDVTWKKFREVSSDRPKKLYLPAALHVQHSEPWRRKTPDWPETKFEKRKEKIRSCSEQSSRDEGSD